MFFILANKSFSPKAKYPVADLRRTLNECHSEGKMRDRVMIQVCLKLTWRLAENIAKKHVFLASKSFSPKAKYPVADLRRMRNECHSEGRVRDGVMIQTCRELTWRLAEIMRHIGIC